MRKRAWLLLLAAGCSDGGGGSGGGLRLGEAPKAPKGYPCSSSSECAEPASRCLVDGAESACSGSLADGAFEVECDGATPEAAAACPGLVCISLKANAQGKAGQCSAPCDTDVDCGETGVCLSVLGDHYCFARCVNDAACSNGFVCTSGLDGLGVCSVKL